MSLEITQTMSLHLCATPFSTRVDDIKSNRRLLKMTILWISHCVYLSIYYLLCSRNAYAHSPVHTYIGLHILCGKYITPQRHLTASWKEKNKTRPYVVTNLWVEYIKVQNNNMELSSPFWIEKLLWWYSRIVSETS